MFMNVKYEILEIRESGVRVKHYLFGKKRDVKNDIDMCIKAAKSYEFVGKRGLIVWV